MASAVVTGGAGFIGSHLIDALVERGDDCTVVDDLSGGVFERVHPSVPIKQADVRDAAVVTRIFAEARPALCFHLAAQADVRVSVERPGFDAEVNVLGTINVLEAARAHGTRVVFASTGGAIYGDVQSIPTPESVTPEPMAAYGTAKLCAEQYLAMYSRLYGAGHANLRFANVYGPRQNPRGEAGVVSIFLGCLHRATAAHVFGDGRQTRDYVHVDDVVSALLRAGEAGIAGTWNVGTGREVSVLELLDLCAGVAGRRADSCLQPARVGELQRAAVDPTRIAQDLGWRPAIELEHGLRSVWEWIVAGEPPRG